MSKKQKKRIDLDGIHDGVKRAGKVTAILLRLVWTLLGVALLIGIIFLSVRCGSSIVSDVNKIFH